MTIVKSQTCISGFVTCLFNRKDCKEWILGFYGNGAMTAPLL